MGEVYRARDTRLDRIVAVKVLAATIADDPIFRERFDREARAISKLDHPNICALYDVGETPNPESQIPNPDPIRFLVMQYLEGETLAERIAKGPIPIDQSFAIMIQIADALTCAHRAGITHRDLKPGNVMLTKAGAKLLDFGLAKTGAATAGHYVPQPATALPTMGAPLTAHGTILGTFQYMAPEQLEGADADTRSDIWAFGALLYETLTGRKAFEGKSQASLIGAIMTSDPPPVSTLQPVAPAALDRIVKKCLAKDPDARWQSARDLHDELQWIARDGQAGSTSQARPATERPIVASRAGLWKAATFVLAASALALASVMFSWRLGPVTPAPVTRFQVSPPEKSSFVSPLGVPNGVNGGTISPDGTRLVFTATDPSGRPLLWIRPLDAFVARPLTGTDGASFPFWSPDSRFIAFFATDKLKRIDAAGGPTQTISDLPPTGARGGTWGTSGIIIFASANSPLYQVSAEGGQARLVTSLDESRKEIAHRGPSFLPDGRQFLYHVSSSSPEATGVYIRSLESGTARRLLASDTTALFVPPGFLLFIREGTLLRQRFDATRLELMGEAILVAEQVSSQTNLGAFSASSTGVLTFRTGARPTTQFAWLDRAGRVLETVGRPGVYQHPALSPDEKRLAFTRYDDQAAGDIWVLDLSRQALSRFTSAAGKEDMPVWTPDGLGLIYNSNQQNSISIVEKSAAGIGAEEVLLKTGGDMVTNDTSPDGKSLLYFPVVAPDIFALPLTGDRKPVPVVQTPFIEAEVQFAPGGRWIAYTSNEAGRNEVYVQPFPPTGARSLISTTGGRQPMWRRDGRELFFVSDDQKFYAVDVRAGSTLEFGTPRFLFDMPANVFNARNSYVPSRDGQRFLVNMLLESSTSSISVVTNWTAELK